MNCIDTALHENAALSMPGIDQTPLPPLPKTVRESGIELSLLVELIAKTIFLFGRIKLPALSSKLKLSVSVLNEALHFMVVEHVAEITRRGASDVDVEYQLTGAGKERAAQFMARCRYVGPAPVTLDAYRAMTARQSVRQNRATQEDVARAFDGLILNPEVREQVGAAMNSCRPLFLYGPAGSGKTYLAERLIRLMRGAVAIPHAIVVENEIIQVFDPLAHQALPNESAQESGERPNVDGRWVPCRRPIVLTGGELTLDMLELVHDRTSGFYQAPPHFKANGGIFIVDDLGRQQIAPKDLMNRWIVPLDRGHDYLSLHTGYKFAAPFDVAVVFSTNLRPESLADASFLRRLGYKIHVGALCEDEYRCVLQQHAQALGIDYDEAVFRYLIDELHRADGRPLLACYPRDLLRQVADYARYRNEPPAMSALALSRAWRTYFAKHHEQTASRLRDKAAERKKLAH